MCTIRTRLKWHWELKWTFKWIDFYVLSENILFFSLICNQIFVYGFHSKIFRERKYPFITSHHVRSIRLRWLLLVCLFVCLSKEFIFGVLFSCVWYKIYLICSWATANIWFCWSYLEAIPLSQAPHAQLVQWNVHTSSFLSFRFQ